MISNCTFGLFYAILCFGHFCFPDFLVGKSGIRIVDFYVLSEMTTEKTKWSRRSWSLNLVESINYEGRKQKLKNLVRGRSIHIGSNTIRDIARGGLSQPSHSSLAGISSAFLQISSVIHPWKKNLKRRGKTGEKHKCLNIWRVIKREN